MNQQAKLSVEDIKRLMEDRSTTAQMDVVSKLSSHYTASGDGAMTANQSAMADDVFRLLLSRAEVQVRALIAQNLKQSDKLPAEIARQMASDVQEVAMPIIEYSGQLTDEDLLNIINASEEEQGKLVAIAKRTIVSEVVADALVETRVEKVAATLVKNEGAAIAEKTFNKIVEHHKASAEVMGSMLERNSIPITVVDSVVDNLSATLRKSLEVKYGNLAEFKELRRNLDKSMDMARFKLMGLNTSDSQLTRLVNYLDENGKLPPFSALSMANIQLFEMSLARILRIPITNVHQLLQDPNGLKALYKQAALPENMYDAVAICVQAILALEEESKTSSNVKILPTPIQLLKRIKEMVAGRAIPNLEQLCAMINEDWATVW